MRFSLQDVKKQVHRRNGELYLSLHFLRPRELRAEIERLVAYYESRVGVSPAPTSRHVEANLSPRQGALQDQPQREFSLDEARACVADYRMANCLLATLSAWYSWQQPDWAETVQQLTNGNPPSTGFDQAQVSHPGADPTQRLTSPVDLRLALFDYVNEHHQGFLDQQERAQALQVFAASHHLDVAALEYLLALDSDEEAILVRNTPRPPTADEVVTLYNQWVFEAALCNASDVHFIIDCRSFGIAPQGSAAGKDSVGAGVGAVIKRLSYLARRLGVYYDLAYDADEPEGRVPAGDRDLALTRNAGPSRLHLTLYGPQEVTGVPQQYGLRLARLCRLLLGYKGHPLRGEGADRARASLAPTYQAPARALPARAIIAAEASVHFQQRSYRFAMDSLEHLAPLDEGSSTGRPQGSPSLYDSSIEQSFAEAFSALEGRQGVDGWRLEREPEPLLLEKGIFIPDFALTRDSRRLYVEILGFWTPGYRERKIQKLQQLQDRDDLVLAIPVEARAVFAGIAAHFPIVWYDGQLSATDLLSVLRARYDDFEERLARIDVNTVRQRVRSVGLLPEQACYELLHCYRRSELQRAVEHVTCEDVAFAAGAGLYHIDWLERVRRSFVEWMDSAGISRLPLAELLQQWRAWAGAEPGRPPSRAEASPAPTRDGSGHSVPRTASPGGRPGSAIAGYEDVTLEALLNLWPDVSVQRASIFDAVVARAGASPTRTGVIHHAPTEEGSGHSVPRTASPGGRPGSTPGSQSPASLAVAPGFIEEEGDVQKAKEGVRKQVRERRATYKQKKRPAPQAIQEDLWDS